MHHIAMTCAGRPERIRGVDDDPIQAVSRSREYCCARRRLPAVSAGGVIYMESDASWGTLSGLLQASEAAEPVVDDGQGGCFGGSQVALQSALGDGS